MIGECFQEVPNDEGEADAILKSLKLLTAKLDIYGKREREGDRILKCSNLMLF